MTVKFERLRDGHGDAAGEPLRVRIVPDAGEEDREFVACQPGKQGAAATRLVELPVDDDPEAVRDHDQQLVAARMAEAVVDHLEPVEIDEQHCAGAVLVGLGQQSISFRTEMKAVRKRGDGVVHAQSLSILDRRAHFREQGVNGGSELGQGLTHDGRRRRDEVAIFHGKKAVAERGQGPGALAVGAFGSDVADEQAEGAGGHGRDNLQVPFADEQERREAKCERGKASRARQKRVADFLGRPCLHEPWFSPFATGVCRILRHLNGHG